MDKSLGGGGFHSAIKDVEENLQHPPLQIAEGKEPQSIENLQEKPMADSSSDHSTSEHDANLNRLDSKIVKTRDAPLGDAAFAHLLEHEREILKRQLDIPNVKVSYKTLYRYATRWDLIITFVSAVSAIAGGAVLPLMTVSSYASLLMF